MKNNFHNHFGKIPINLEDIEKNISLLFVKIMVNLHLTFNKNVKS